MSPERERALRRNIWLLEVVRSARMALVAIPVIVLFWTEDCGIDALGVFMLQVIFALTVTLIEVPSGYVSDRLGRRPTLLLSSMLALVGWGMYGLSSSFLHLALTEVVLGLAIAFWSGTDAAMLYETIQELGLGDQALSRESRNLFLKQTTESVASIFGGYLAVWVSLRATVWATAVPYLAAFVLVWFLTEPAREQSEEHPSLGQAWRYLREALGQPDLRLILLAGGLLSASTLTAVWLHQLLWLRAEMPLELFGWSWAALNMAVALSALLSPWLHRRLGTLRTLGLLGLWAAATFALLGLWISPWVVLAGCALNLVRGVGTPILVTGINQRVADDRRATVLSTLSLTSRSIFVSFAPLVGCLAKQPALTAACLASCALGLMATLVVTLFSSKLDA